MADTRSEVLKESRRKGLVAAVATGGAVTLGVLGAPVLATVAAVPAAILSYRWWKHRAQNGIKF